MASAIAAAAQAAHSVAASVLSVAQIKPGATLPKPSSSLVLKENAADETVDLDLSGKVLIVCFSVFCFVFVEQESEDALSDRCSRSVHGDL